ncbi:alpha/beta hydrolase [Brachybacterium sp. MASK1Z-5]|uniref:Alpha/beta hydrolase n=1 Tax=Brachybacterium halotolerans TaxID=2795215 RepID=A0ABS1BE07_9MICO|nr:alpha/beta hydrolase [Brachybacterium halotolerans]MBK0332382.1 alpha/beta hydrolase [Brachybacterium halotolerans]
MTETTKNIRFRSPGMAWDLAGVLHLPEDFDAEGSYPAIVSVHPIGSCKEQTAGNVYAKGLAEAGYVVLAFDASFQGESGGEPRLVEDPAQRVEDVRVAIDHLVTLPYVDADRIGGIGVCGGGGYVLNATMSDRRIKAVASITGVNFGRLSREAFSGYDPIGALEQMSAQRTSEARGEDARVDDYLPASVAEGRSAGIEDIDMLEATDYYKTDRGRTPGGATSAAFSRRAAAMGWDAFLQAETLLTQPMLIVIGEKPGGFGAYRDGQEIYGRAPSKDKQLLVLPGVSHYELYDQPEPTGKALAAATEFFGAHL